MTKEMLLLIERFGISQEKAEELINEGLYGVFVVPTFDKSEPEDEIHLKHQLYSKFNTKEEQLVAETTEKVSFKMDNGTFKVTGIKFAR